jgi:hypothetical protein
MDYFEEICKYLLEQENYWVRTCVKVEITKEEKRQLGKPSMPRPEIDIVAYNPKQNLLILIEAKSFLNSSGVYIEHVQDKDMKYDGYKILTGKMYQEVVTNKLIEIYLNSGLLSIRPNIQYGLIAGNVAKNKNQELQELAIERNWFYWGPEKLKEGLMKFKDYPYENNPFVLTSKILNKECK